MLSQFSPKHEYSYLNSFTHVFEQTYRQPRMIEDIRSSAANADVLFQHKSDKILQQNDTD